MSPTATRPAWGPAHCGCGCRPEDAHADGCPCPECQPGPGIDYLARSGRMTARRQRRIQELLRKPRLTPEEESELDDLLHWYIHR